MEMVRSHLPPGGQEQGADVDMSKCPFSQALAAETGAEHEARMEEQAIIWTASAEARLHRIPAIIRPMARKGIEEFARSQGVQTITPALLDEAREKMDM